MTGLELKVSYRVHQGLRIDVSLRLGPICGVLFGRSGAGKTTLLKIIAGLERPDAGLIRLGDSVLFDSARRTDRPLRERRVGMVFQDDLLFPHLNVARNVSFGLRGRTRAEAAARVAEVAALCGVEKLLDRMPETLSGGERQRVGLARALAPRPRLLLCDEPVSALDLANRNALVDRLRSVQAAEAVPLLYVTHSPAEAVALGSHLFLLEGGRVVAEGPPLDVLATSGAGVLEGVRNVFRAEVIGPGDGVSTTPLRLEDGPVLLVPRVDRPPGTAVTVEVLAEEILLARGPVEGLSARNVIAGVVERVLVHGAEAEVVVRTGGASWVASVVESARDALGLAEGVPVHLVIKARSCRVVEKGG